MLIKQTLLYLPAQLLGPMFQFIAAVVWTHWLSADAYGVLTYVLASHELIFVACLAWWSQYTLRFAGTFTDEADRERFQASENAIIICGVPFQTVLVILLLSALHVPLTASMITVALICCVSRAVTTHLCERARGQGRVLVYTVGQSVGPVAGFVVALALVRFLSATPEAALAGFAVVQTAVIPWMWHELGLNPRVARLDRDIVKGALMFGMPLMMAGGIAWISGNGIRLVVEHVNGAEAVGLLSVGWGLGQRLSSVVAMLVTAAAFPLAVKHMVDGSREGAVRQLAMGGAILYGLVAPATAGILLITRPMVELMISLEFREMTIAVLPMAAVAGAVRNLRIHFCDQIFILFEQTRLTIVINAVETVATVVLCFAGAMYDGPVGAVAGCLAGAIIGALFAFVLGMAKFGLIVPWDHVARISAASAVMSSVLMTPLVVGLAHTPLMTILVKVAIAVIVYPLALAALYPSALRGLVLKARALRPAAG